MFVIRSKKKECGIYLYFVTIFSTSKSRKDALEFDNKEEGEKMLEKIKQAHRGLSFNSDDYTVT